MNQAIARQSCWPTSEQRLLLRAVLLQGENSEEKVIALAHPDLLAVSKEQNRPLTDPWCMKLAALHLREMIETDRDMDKVIVLPTLEDLRRHAAKLEQPVPVRR